MLAYGRSDMPLTVTAQQAAARQVAQDLFVAGNKTASLSLGDILAAVQAVDSALDTTLGAAVTATSGTTTILQYLNSVLPSPTNTATAAQILTLIARVQDKRAGLI
jgi:hypothetical protein